MALLTKKLSATRQALATLQEVLLLEQSQVVRDSSIQRFEYTLDLFWKLLKEALLEWEGKDVAFPKAAMRTWGVRVKLEPEVVEVLLEMVDDRNLTTHTYDEKTVLCIYERLPRYAALIEQEVMRVETELSRKN